MHTIKKLCLYQKLNLYNLVFIVKYAKLLFSNLPLNRNTLKHIHLLIFN